MKAIQIRQTGLYDALQYVDVETPSPGEGQVLVRTVAASVNFADTMIRKGTYPVMPPLPLVPGFECSGFVEAVGERVTQIRQGQSVIVFSSQCYAEFVLADARSVFPIPEQVNLEEAAAIPVVYLTAFHLLHTVAGVHAGQTILVYGASGGVGTAIVQLAKRAGLRVIGLTSSEDKVQFAKITAKGIPRYRIQNEVYPPSSCHLPNALSHILDLIVDDMIEALFFGETYLLL